MFTNCVIFSFIAANEISCAACTEPLDSTRILLREKSLGNDDVEINAQRSRGDRNQQRQGLMAKNQLQAAAVESQGYCRRSFR